MTALSGLIRARVSANLSQATVGQVIGKTQSHYSKIERGIIGLDAHDALTLCQYFGVGLEELLK
jgi:transcriptional regulator with XRE-family HTH domain